MTKRMRDDDAMSLPMPTERMAPPQRQPWWESRENLIILVQWLAHDMGESGHSVAYAVSKPWHYEDQFRRAIRQELERRENERKAAIDAKKERATWTEEQWEEWFDAAQNDEIDAQ